MADFKYSAGIDVNLNIKNASSLLQELLKLLAQISNMKIDVGTGNLTTDIEKASQAAMLLSAHLATAINQKTGNLDFTKFYTSIQKSGASLLEYGEALLKMGPAGQKAFVNLADSISKSEIPLKRTSLMVDKMWDGLKRTASWQLLSTIIHGIMGSIQSAVGYAKDLNSSLNDIRIVTGQSTELMAQFAKLANLAAKSLSTTTTDYTKASLIYYQLGLSDAEVKARAEATIKMANVSGQSAEKVSSLMTAIWNNYDNGSKSLEYYGDVITALGAKTASSSEEIALGILKFAAVSDTIGLSYEYAASALATVTATTRESADIVGNAYKTLFSRIQGLNLGETLDDGTTLNKYSTALAKVGISIKDSSGNLKDMDSILNEMGSKWETLSKDQQTALALTVAGVRQYTQLVALMNNWDYFQQNLLVAKTSSGTLDAQAAIFAESWEAASDRVRASWEGLWDNLIDSDGFITILNGLSGFINILDLMVTGLGGAGGAFLSFGGILSKVFNALLSTGISNIAYGVKMMMPGSQDAMISERNKIISDALNIIGKDSWDTYGRDIEYTIKRQGMTDSLNSSLLYSLRKSKLSENLLILDLIYSRAVDESYELLLAAGKQYDKSKEFRADFHGLFYDDKMSHNLLSNENVESVYQKRIDNVQASIESRQELMRKIAVLERLGLATQELLQKRENLGAETRLLLSVKLDLINNRASNISSFNSKIFNRNQLISEKTVDEAITSTIAQRQSMILSNKGKKFSEWSLEDLAKFKQFGASLNLLRGTKDLFTIPIKLATSFSEALMSQGKATANFNKALISAAESGDVNTLIAGLNEFTSTASNSMGSNEFLKNLINLAKPGKSADEIKAALSSPQYKENINTFMKSSMDSVTGAIYDAFSNDVDFIGKGLTREQFMANAAKAYLGTHEDQARYEAALRGYELRLLLKNENLKKESTQSIASGIVSGALGLMLAAAAGEQIKTLATSIQDGTMTFTSALTGLTSTILSSAMGFQGLHSALAMIPSLGAGAASGIALAVTALLALANTAAEFWDLTHTSNEEMMLNFTNSDNELTTAASTAAKAAEIAKAQNEEYLTGVEKIKSLSQDPTTLAEDIYESNKRALELISQYGLQLGANGYIYSANGLIEIDKKVLDSQVKGKESETQITDYALLMGLAANTVGRAEINAIDSKKAFSNMVQYARLGYYAELGSSWMPTEEELLEARRSGDEAWNVLQEKYNWDNLNPIQITEKETTGITRGLTKADWDKLYDEAGKVINADNNKDFAKILLDLASQVVANKALADNGITAATQEGFAGYQAVVADSIKQQFQDVTDIVANNRVLNEDAVKLILESLGQKGAHGFRVDSGVVYYTLDGESQERSYTGETLNYLNAANLINSKKAIEAADTAWKEAINNFGPVAAEAGLNIEKLGTISGASADSVLALFQDEEKFKSAYGDKTDIADKEYAKVREIFGDGGIVKALGLDLDSATLSEVSMGTLETLQNQAENIGAEGATYIGELFKRVKEATDAESAEDLAKIVTALSSMDFSENSYLNLLNLKSTLESFGFKVDTSGLEALYAILAKLAGLSPGGGLGDLADVNKEIANKRGALNEVTPGGEVDETTMQNAKNAGLTEGWVKSGDGKYTYTGTQEDIDREKNRANRAWADSLANIDAELAAYSKATEQGMNLSPSGNYNTNTLMSALGYKKGFLGFGAGWGEDTTQLDALAEALGMTSDEVKSQLEAGNSDFVERVNDFLKNGSMTDLNLSAGAEDYMANINSVSDMIKAITDAKNRDDTAGFLDDKKMVSEEAINRLNTLKLMYPELAAEIESFTESLNDMTWALLEAANAAYEAAQQFGIAYDDVRLKMEELRADPNNANVSESTLAKYAAEIIKADKAAQELRSSYTSLMEDLSGVNGANAKNTALPKLANLLRDIAKLSDNAAISTLDLTKAYERFNKKYPNGLSKIMEGDLKAIRAFNSEIADGQVAKALGIQVDQIEDYYNSSDNFKDNTPATAFTEDIAAAQEILNSMDTGLYLDQMIGDNGAVSAQAQATMNTILSYFDGLVSSGRSAGEAMQQTATKFNVEFEPAPTWIDGATMSIEATDMDAESGEFPEEVLYYEGDTHKATLSLEGGAVTGWRVKNSPGGGGGSGGGGGGGGGPKEPKKVANKNKSQTVKRYKRADTKRSSAGKSKKSEENKKDYLYGESKIALMEKINKLAEKEAKITADRIKESRTYLIEDRENLIKYLQKYGYEAEFDADGFLANYEKVWTDVYEQIAALYEDNELTEEESKIEEDLNVMLEELEGALEDYENSLSELQDDIEAYEETLYEMYDNKVEALEHKIEFKIELSEDDLDYLDFWIESLGDNIYNALEAIEVMGAKANALFDGLETYLQGIIDIMSLSDDPLQVWATGGIEEILTQALVDALRENRDGLADYMQLLIDLRDEIKDKVLDTFDSWQEKLDSTLTTIEHYTSVLEHFKNMIDVVGKDSLGLSNLFMANLEQNAINLSLDSIDANKAYYDNLVEILQEAQEKLEEARARGDQSSADHWEEIVKSTTEAMQDAQDALLTSLEDSLNLIAEQFETNMERAVEAFNDAIYAYGGLEGLSSDYDRIRENADLMAADYEKIYELSKITRNINKTLDDTNIIAGKLKLISLLKEINNLQNSGVELSKYDLEYLLAKYELRLAEIELENALNAKDTVRLSRDSEGNWSYIYTLNADAVEEAGQKYEDALYEMLKLSQEYLEEMSSSMLDTSSAMMEEISGLRIQDFNSYEEYQVEIKRIQDKYAESLKLQEAELNKAVSNSQLIYELDWRNYNLITGYKISESEKWIDAFKESTIGQLLNSDTIMSSFSDTFLGLTEILTKNLADSAVNYFTNIDKAFATYGTSIEDFGKHVEDSTKKISDKSKEAAGDTKKMASEMNDAFKEIADTVSSWQEQFSSEIDKMLEKIKTLILDINEAIETSANLQSDNRNSSELIGLDEAIDLLNEQKLWGTWGRSENGALTLNGNATTFTDFNGELIQEIDDKMTKMFNAKTGSEERSKLEEEVKELFKQYWLFKDIVGRVYDVTDLLAPTYASLDTGGYTGEWGDSGKFAMLHEKELVLNKDDTKNFLDALNLSKDIINSMIEMNAKLSSLALGDLVPTSIQDMSQVLELSVTILAEFPNATDHSEIEEAFNNLINTASQYANRRK